MVVEGYMNRGATKKVARMAAKTTLRSQREAVRGVRCAAVVVWSRAALGHVLARGGVQSSEGRRDVC